MGEKKKVSVTIDKQVYEKSHSLGINVSKACENYLKTLNQAIENTANGKPPFLGEASFGKEVSTGREGFEPSTSSLEGTQPLRGTAEYWVAFRIFVNSRIKNKSWSSTIFNYAQQYSSSIFSRNLSAVQALPDSKRPNILKALSTLAKFDGCSDDYKQLMKQYGLHWTGRSKDDIFIDRLTSTQDPESIWKWVKEVKHELPEISLLLDLMSVSGLRFIEGINSYNLIIKLTETGKLQLDRDGKNYRGGYFNREIASLEHFWFRDIFLRNTKKAFVSFVPSSLIAKIGELDRLSAEQVQQLVRRRGLPCRFSDIREAHGTFITKYLKESEINFLHGRVTSSVFMANYFNPVLISDLKSRAFQGIQEIQQKTFVAGGEKF